jgi:hypothetical protein
MKEAGTAGGYSYKCARATLSDCITKETAETWGNGATGQQHTVHFLDRQAVILPQGDYALTQFRLRVRYAERTYYRYAYTYCKLTAPLKIRGYIRNSTTNAVIPTSTLLAKNFALSFQDASKRVYNAATLEGSIYEVSLVPGTYTRSATATDFSNTTTSVVIILVLQVKLTQKTPF